MGCNASLEHWDYSDMVEVWAKDLIFILWKNKNRHEEEEWNDVKYGSEVNLLTSYLPWGVKLCEVYILQIISLLTGDMKSINWPRSQWVTS